MIIFAGRSLVEYGYDNPWSCSEFIYFSFLSLCSSLNVVGIHWFRSILLMFDEKHLLCLLG